KITPVLNFTLSGDSKNSNKRSIPKFDRDCQRTKASENGAINHLSVSLLLTSPYNADPRLPQRDFARVLMAYYAVVPFLGPSVSKVGMLLK
ncbi:hypothetical protein TSAR_004149, partial [Trichomalopsis sarcophagae]